MKVETLHRVPAAEHWYLSQHGSPAPPHFVQNPPSHRVSGAVHDWPPQQTWPRAPQLPRGLVHDPLLHVPAIGPQEAPFATHVPTQQPPSEHALPAQQNAPARPQETIGVPPVSPGAGPSLPSTPPSTPPDPAVLSPRPSTPPAPPPAPPVVGASGWREPSLALSPSSRSISRPPPRSPHPDAPSTLARTKAAIRASVRTGHDPFANPRPARTSGRHP